MTIGINVDIRNASMNLLKSAIDAGTGTGKINFYDGVRPATGVAITNQVLLGTVLCSKPCGTVADGALVLAALTDDENAAATGNATWARITANDDTFVCDLEVASVFDPEGDADIIMNSTAIMKGGIIRVHPGTLTSGNE